MLLTVFHGFCMALADSVPGVSGGTIAFILGFYDRFIFSLHKLFGKNKAERRAALVYIIKLGLGWSVGMAACITMLSGLFEKNIYFMSSLFLGLTIASVPFIIAAERKSVKRYRNMPFAALGLVIVVGLTMLRGNTILPVNVSFAELYPPTLIYIFLAGAVAVTAMVLPGISGSSVLLIAGVYLPAIRAAHSFLCLQLDVIPGLFALGAGIIAGILLSINGIRTALQKYRSQTVYLIIGLMLGSCYAIINGPRGLNPPMAPLSISSFRISAFLLGIAIMPVLELLKSIVKQKGGHTLES